MIKTCAVNMFRLTTIAKIFIILHIYAATVLILCIPLLGKVTSNTQKMYHKSCTLITVILSTQNFKYLQL